MWSLNVVGMLSLCGRHVVRMLSVCGRHGVGKGGRHVVGSQVDHPAKVVQLLLGKQAKIGCLSVFVIRSRFHCL